MSWSLEREETGLLGDLVALAQATEGLPGLGSRLAPDSRAENWWFEVLSPETVEAGESWS